MRKWLVLLSYCMANVLNGMSWVNLVPIPDEGMSFFNISEFELTFYSYIFYITSILTAQISNYIVAKSLFYSIHLLWILTTVGCWIRVIAEDRFWISFAGQFIIALGNMIIASANSVVATLWFPNSDIVLAISIASASNFIGVGITFITLTNGVGIMAYMWMQAVLSSVFFFFNVFSIRHDPVEKKDFDLKKELLLCLKDFNLMVIVFCTASVLGIEYSIISTIGILLEQVGFGMKQTGLLSFIFTIAGMGGGLIATYIAESRGSTKISLCVIAIGTIVFSIVFSAVININYANYIVGALYGACITAVLPLGIKASTEYMKEVHDSVPANLIYLIALIFSCIYAYPIQYFYEITGVSGIWIGTIILFLSCVPLLWFSEKVKGDNFDRISFRDE